MSRLFVLGALTTVVALVGCGSSKLGELPHDDGGEGGEGGADDGGKCVIDPPGEDFVFEILNSSDGAIEVQGGCVDRFPMQLEEQGERHYMSAEGATACGYKCDGIYDGGSHAEGACSDCGSTGLEVIESGELRRYAWDRRVYTAHTAPAECSGHEDDNFCALGRLIDTKTARAIFSYKRLEPADVYAKGDTIELPFSFELDRGEVTIEVE